MNNEKETHPATQKLRNAYVSILEAIDRHDIMKAKKQIEESGFAFLLGQCKTELQNICEYSDSEADDITRPLSEVCGLISYGRSPADDAASLREKVRNANTAQKRLTEILLIPPETTELVKPVEGEIPTESGKSDDDDLSAYVPISELLQERPDQFKRLSDCTRFLDNHKKEIRSKNPTPNRRIVHAGDWHRYWKKPDDEQSAMLDNENLQEAIANVEARKLDEQKLKDEERKHIG